jgi:hypothetical protein
VPYQNGVRVSNEWWAANRPDHPPGTVVDSESGRVITDLSSVGLTGEDLTTAQALKATRNRNARLAAIADAAGVVPDSPELAAVNLTGEYVSESGRSRAPWDTDEDDDEPSQPSPAPRSRPESPKTASGAVIAVPVDHEPVGPTTHAQEQAFAARKGLTSKRNRRSQTSPGRHERHVKAMAARWGVTVEVADDRIEHRKGSSLTCPIRHPELAS